MKIGFKTFQLKKDFRAVPKDLLDPFNRFVFHFDESTPDSEAFYRRWFCERRKTSIEGCAFEAIIACHAVHKEACVNCKMRNALRWIGGGKSAWLDLVCTFCHSTFEIKTKETPEKCHDEFKRNRIPAGSYEHYWKQRNAMINNRKSYDRKCPPKMFLVVVPRRSNRNYRGTEIHPVFCREIAFAVPRLTPTCFCTAAELTRLKWSGGKSIPLQSSVKTDANSHKVWFELEALKEPIDSREIIEEVFIKHYTREEFERVENLIKRELTNELKTDQDGQKPVIEALHVEEVEDAAERLKKELEGMKLEDDGADEWESLYDV